VKGGTEPGISGVRVDLFDVALGSVVATTQTAGDGNYRFEALLGGAYQVKVDAGTLPAGLVPSFDPDGIPSANQFALDLGCDAVAGNRDFGYAPTNTAVLPGFGGAEALRQNVPNPFNPRTGIEFDLAENGFAELVVYDVAGRRVKALVREERSAGPHRVEWDGQDEHGDPVPSGVYYYALRTAQGCWMRRMTLLR
jgi:hypothetical protein